MAKLIALVFLVSCILAVPPTTHAIKKSSWFQNICSGIDHEKVAKVHFYVHAVMTGLNQTEYEVARAEITSNSTTSFGRVLVADNLLTAQPAYDSERVGRSQGFITSIDLETFTFKVDVIYYFTSGKYNGSTISITGRNQVGNTNELQVVGGTGVFRGVRGYAIANTYSYDVETGNGIYEYTLYVTYVDDSNRASTGGRII